MLCCTFEVEQRRRQRQQKCVNIRSPGRFMWCHGSSLPICVEFSDTRKTLISKTERVLQHWNSTGGGVGASLNNPVKTFPSPYTLRKHSFTDINSARERCYYTHSHNLPPNTQGKDVVNNSVLQRHTFPHLALVMKQYNSVLQDRKSAENMGPLLKGAH